MPAAPREEEIRKARAEAAARAAADVQMVQNRWPDEQFDQWVFQQDRNVEGVRKRFETMSAMQIEEIDRTCSLSAEQKAKLQLMVRGDIKRFIDGFDKAKQRFKQMDNDVNRLQEIMPDVTPLQTAARSGIFQGDSLFAKSMRTTLTSEQRGKYDAVMQERRLFRHRAQVELAVNMIEQTAPLRDSQRRDLIALMTSETKPSKGVLGYYEFYYIMYELGRVPEEKLKPIFTDSQWKVVTRLIAQYKGMAPQLRQQGLLSDD